MKTNADPHGLYAIVLAAGASRRLGTPKQLLGFRGKTLIEHAISNARTICSSRVVAVLGAFSNRIRPLVESSPVSIVENSDWESGMASSLRAGLHALPPGCKAVLILLCDQPKISTADLKTLAAAWAEHPDRIVASRYDDVIGVPAIFPRSAFAKLDRLSGDSGARKVLKEAEGTLIAVPLAAAAFDVDDQTTAQQLKSSEKKRERA